VNNGVPERGLFSEALLLFFFFTLIVTILISCFSSEFSVSLRGEYLLDYPFKRQERKRFQENELE